MKKGYFVDEIWSYGLSNSYYHAQLEDNKFIGKCENIFRIIQKYLTVDEGKILNLGSVVNNSNA